jgi:hypothetical protein
VVAVVDMVLWGGVVVVLITFGGVIEDGSILFFAIRFVPTPTRHMPYSQYDVHLL